MLVVNKNFFNSISVSKNSDKIISSTRDNFAGIRPGTYIKIGNLDFLYSIATAKHFFYSKDFYTNNSRKLVIPTHTNIFLQNDDVIKIIYDEFKFDYVLNIVNAGKHYLAGDILIVNGGVPSFSLIDGNISPTKLIVDEVNPDGGAITKISLNSRGKYITPPSGQISLSGGHGEGVVLELKYSLIENRNIEERTIKNIEFLNGETILTIDYPLPPNISGGHLSLEKWEINLTSNYMGETELNIEYKLFQDFSPNYKFPLTVKNNNEFHLVFNDAIMKIDKEIKRLESLIISS